MQCNAICIGAGASGFSGGGVRLNELCANGPH